jgi:hemerythrin
MNVFVISVSYWTRSQLVDSGKMKDLQWKDGYSLGIPAIDLQHRRIFDCFITIAGESTKHDKLLAEFAVARLAVLLQEHFGLEERMMRTLCYPELERHIEQHRGYGVDVDDLAQKTAGTKAGLSLEMIKATQKWLRDHIATSDQHYMDFFLDPVGLALAKDQAGESAAPLRSAVYKPPPGAQTSQIAV